MSSSAAPEQAEEESGTDAKPGTDETLWGQLGFPFGYPAAIDRIGTTAAPLLAGFAFTLIALTLDQKGDLWNPDLTLLLLVVASVTLVCAVQFSFNARRYYVSVEEYYDLVKLATEDGIGASKAKEMSREFLGLHNTWADRSRVAYNLGVAVLFIAVATALVPTTGIGHMAPLRAAAVLVLVAAGSAEVVLSLFDGITGFIGRLREPGSKKGRPHGR